MPRGSRNVPRASPRFLRRRDAFLPTLSGMALLWAGGGLCQEVLVLDLLRAGTCEATDAELRDRETEPEQ